MKSSHALSPVLLIALLAGCSGKPGADEVAQELAEPPATVQGDADGSKSIAVSVPQIAYAYEYGFRLDGDRIAAAQDAHMALCDRMGPTRCRILDMRRQASGNGYSNGSLKLEVESQGARAFGTRLAQAVASAGGAQTDSNISAEDLSKKIVDTQARLRSRQLLATRLTELLQSRKGSVAELVEAERSVAAVQEEIDEAQSWLAEMRGRVAMSSIEIRYAGSDSSGFLAPLRTSLHTMGEVAGASLAVLIQLIALALPWTLLGALLLFFHRRFGGRLATLLRRPPAGE